MSSAICKSFSCDVQIVFVLVMTEQHEVDVLQLYRLPRRNASLLRKSTVAMIINFAGKIQRWVGEDSEAVNVQEHAGCINVRNVDHHIDLTEYRHKKVKEG